MDQHSGGSDGGAWRENTAWRRNAVQRIEEALKLMPPGAKQKSAPELEDSICKKVNTKEDYINMVQKLVLILRSRGQQLQQQQQQQHQTIGEGQQYQTTGDTMMPQQPVPQGQLHQQHMQMQPMNQAMMRGQMGQAGGAVSQLQQRLTRMPQTPNMMGGQRMMAVPSQRMPGGGIPMSVQQGMMPQVSAGQMMGHHGRGPPPMYGMSPAPQHMSQAMPMQGSPAAIMSHSPASQYIHSPVSQHGMPSPAGQRANMVPSPMSSANTPQPPHSTGGGDPQQQEEQQYLEKIRQLSKYITPLTELIANIGNNNDDQGNQGKLDKMKKLLDILSNPSKRMPMDTLLKCEKVLVRMNFNQNPNQASSAAASSSSSSTGNEVNPLLEAVANLRKNAAAAPDVNQALRGTFGGALETVYGVDIALPSVRRKRRRRHSSSSDEEDDGLPFVLRKEIGHLRRPFRATPNADQRLGGAVALTCRLEDPSLPVLPAVTVSVGRDYPQTSPCCGALNEYLATPYLRSVRSALLARLAKMPERHTLSQFFSAWEMAARSACSPRQLGMNKVSLSSPAEALLGL